MNCHNLYFIYDTIIEHSKVISFNFTKINNYVNVLFYFLESMHVGYSKHLQVDDINVEHDIPKEEDVQLTAK